MSDLYSGIFKTRWFVLPVVLFTLVYNIPKFFELRLVFTPEGSSQGNQTQNCLDVNLNNTVGCSARQLESDVVIERNESENLTDSESFVDIAPTAMRINRVSETQAF